MKSVVIFLRASLFTLVTLPSLDTHLHIPFVALDRVRRLDSRERTGAAPFIAGQRLATSLLESKPIIIGREKGGKVILDDWNEIKIGGL
jgi:hypothetical protein